jgi:hypothetical protein
VWRVRVGGAERAEREMSALRGKTRQNEESAEKDLRGLNDVAESGVSNSNRNTT